MKYKININDKTYEYNNSTIEIKNGNVILNF